MKFGEHYCALKAPTVSDVKCVEFMKNWAVAAANIMCLRFKLPLPCPNPLPFYSFCFQRQKMDLNNQEKTAGKKRPRAPPPEIITSLVKRSDGTKKTKVYKIEKNVTKYAKGNLKFKPSEGKYKGLRKTLQETQEKILDAATRTAATEVLLPQSAGFMRAEGNERTFKLKQSEMLHEVDLNTAKNAMDLQLTKFGPYRVNYSRNGRCVTLSI
jgi:hypothetical protein